MQSSDEVRGSTNLTITVRDDDSGAETNTKLNLFGDPRDKVMRSLNATQGMLVSIGVASEDDLKPKPKAKPDDGPKEGS